MTDNTSSVDLTVDEDLVGLISDIFEGFSGPTAEPDAAAVWATLQEVGFNRLTAPEDNGGSGATWVEAAALLRGAAEAGVAVPYAETDLVVGPLRRAAGLDDSSQGMAAFGVVGSDGIARHVVWAGATESILLLRRSGAGYEVAEIAAADAQLTEAHGISADPTADVDASAVNNWTAVDAASAEKAIAAGALARAIACTGALDGMLASAIEHVTQRNQFGRPLAKFQSVQNLVVDIAAESVLARTAADAALEAWLIAEQTGADEDFATALYRIAVARSVVSVALGVGVRNAHQAHGAIGTTHEHTLHRLTLPALQWRGEFGSVAVWEGALQETLLKGGRDEVWPTISEGSTVGNVPAKILEQMTA